MSILPFFGLHDLSSDFRHAVPVRVTAAVLGRRAVLAARGQRRRLRVLVGAVPHPRRDLGDDGVLEVAVLLLGEEAGEEALEELRAERRVDEAVDEEVDAGVGHHEDVVDEVDDDDPGGEGEALELHLGDDEDLVAVEDDPREVADEEEDDDEEEDERLAVLLGLGLPRVGVRSEAGGLRAPLAHEPAERGISSV